MPPVVGIVIVCAGKGKRLGRIDKASLGLNGKPLFWHALKVFCTIATVREIVLVLQKQHFAKVEKLIRSTFPSGLFRNKRIIVTAGGRERSDSVHNGLHALSDDVDCVLIHDGARPFVSRKLILRIIQALRSAPAVICAVTSRDTLKRVRSGFVAETLDRSDIVLVQTPQGFKKDVIFDAYRRRARSRRAFDDAQLLEHRGVRVKVIEGEIGNFKITYPEDITLAKRLKR